MQARIKSSHNTEELSMQGARNAYRIQCLMLDGSAWSQMPRGCQPGLLLSCVPSTAAPLSIRPPDEAPVAFQAVYREQQYWVVTVRTASLMKGPFRAVTVHERVVRHCGRCRQCANNAYRVVQRLRVRPGAGEVTRVARGAPRRDVLDVAVTWDVCKATCRAAGSLRGPVQRHLSGGAGVLEHDVQHLQPAVVGGDVQTTSQTRQGS